MEELALDLEKLTLPGSELVEPAVLESSSFVKQVSVLAIPLPLVQQANVPKSTSLKDRIAKCHHVAQAIEVLKEHKGETLLFEHLNLKGLKFSSKYCEEHCPENDASRGYHCNVDLLRGYGGVASYLLHAADWVSMKEVRNLFPPRCEHKFGHVLKYSTWDVIHISDKDYSAFLSFMVLAKLGQWKQIAKESIQLKCIVLDDFSIDVEDLDSALGILTGLFSNFRVCAFPEALEAQNIKINGRSLDHKERKQYYELIKTWYPQLLAGARIDEGRPEVLRVLPVEVGRHRPVCRQVFEIDLSGFEFTDIEEYLNYITSFDVLKEWAKVSFKIEHVKLPQSDFK